MVRMRRQAEIMVLRQLQSGQTLTIEELVERLPEVQWDRIFRAVKVLSARNQVVLRARGFGYELSRNGAHVARWRAVGGIRPCRGNGLSVGARSG